MQTRVLPLTAPMVMARNSPQMPNLKTTNQQSSLLTRKRPRKPPIDRGDPPQTNSTLKAKQVTKKTDSGTPSGINILSRAAPPPISKGDPPQTNSVLMAKPNKPEIDKGNASQHNAIIEGSSSEEAHAAISKPMDHHEVGMTVELLSVE
ncbi:PREDICTED: uncharacterized protein LOC104611113 [Nelumbo nucifera]|uniref:Uncharacterized protein n=2 Tax=Nelumbo nucifera TaxID=4432 RepID=A0A822Y7W2_NELNU|nr:PREDICTED: uncharacterized protein LOC104611113 [Nelumbo nucifera]DAD30124.1 TPA_asm: hypothetical protein HUJ06_031592 [Nelumbo nucifera]